MSTTDVWVGLRDHVGTCKLIICDLWGVMHDGITLFDSAVNAILMARLKGIKTVFLTNAPKPASVIRSQLADKGLPEDLLDHIVSSGSQARAYVRDHLSGKKLYHQGPDHDHQAVEGLPVTISPTLDGADFIFASGLDYPTAAAHQSALDQALARRMPFLCANPDRVVHVGNKEWICAGAVAEIYQAMGGETHWFGKPTPSAFAACAEKAGLADTLAADDVLVIGDSMLTDMAGAAAAGHQSLLITSGIHRNSFKHCDLQAETTLDWSTVKGLPDTSHTHNAQPTAVMSSLRW